MDQRLRNLLDAIRHRGREVVVDSDGTVHPVNAPPLVPAVPPKPATRLSPVTFGANVPGN